LIVDAKSQLPISLTVTKGSESDASQLKPLVDSATSFHPDINIEKLPADKAYDALEIYRYLIDDKSIEPFIPLKSYKNPIAVRDLHLSTDGKWLCPAGNVLVYWGFDKSRNRFKFRCPAALGKCSCLLFNSCSLSSYGRTFYLSPANDYRIIGFTDRNSSEWKSRTASFRKLILI